MRLSIDARISAGENPRERLLHVSLSRAGAAVQPRDAFELFIEPEPIDGAMLSAGAKVHTARFAAGASDAVISGSNATFAFVDSRTAGTRALRILHRGTTLARLDLPLGAPPGGAGHSLAATFDVPTSHIEPPALTLFITHIDKTAHSFALTCLGRDLQNRRSVVGCGVFHPHAETQPMCGSTHGGTLASLPLDQVVRAMVADAESFLASGHLLWDKLPCAFRHLFMHGIAGAWAPLKDATGAWLVVADDWAFPFELVIPREPPRLKPRSLGARFPMTRWRDGRPLTGALEVSRLYACFPRLTQFRGGIAAFIDDGDAYARLEAECLQHFARRASFNAYSELSLGTAVELKATLKARESSFVHVRTHGNSSTLTLDNGNGGSTSLTAREFVESATKDDDSTKVLVVNACKTSSSPQDQSWPAALFAFGIDAFILTLWSVHEFSSPVAMLQMLDRLAAGSTLGEAMLTLRRPPFQKLNDRHELENLPDDEFDYTFQSFVAYGHPNARLKVTN